MYWPSDTTPEVIFHIRSGAQEVIRGRVHRIEPNLAIRHTFFDNETILVFITLRSRVNLTTMGSCARSLQETNALSAANQSGRTIVAI